MAERIESSHREDQISCIQNGCTHTREPSSSLENTPLSPTARVTMLCVCVTVCVVTVRALYLASSAWADEVLVVGTSTVDHRRVGAARHRCATRATAGATIMLDIARCCALLPLHGGELWHRRSRSRNNAPGGSSGRGRGHGRGRGASEASDAAVAARVKRAKRRRTKSPSPSSRTNWRQRRASSGSVCSSAAVASTFEAAAARSAANGARRSCLVPKASVASTSTTTTVSRSPVRATAPRRRRCVRACSSVARS